MHSLKLFALFLVLQFTLKAQVKFEYDFNQAPARTNYQSWVEIDGKMYFSANDGYFGYELWQFDPATEQAHRLTDIHSQSGWSEPTNITAYDGTVYFTAYAGELGSQFFRFDPQTWEVEQVTQNQPYNFQPRQLAVYKGKLWFTANGGGDFNLWNYDAATDAFTEVVPPTNGPANPRDKFIYNDKLYFTAQNTDNDWLLWSYNESTNEFIHEPTQFDATGSYWSVVGFVECNGEMMLNIQSGASEKWHHYNQMQDSLIFLSNNNTQVYRGGDCLDGEFWSVLHADNAIQIYDPATGQSSTLYDLNPDGTYNPYSFKIIDGGVYFMRYFDGEYTISKYEPSTNSVEVIYEDDSVATEMETLMKRGNDFYFFGDSNLEREVYKYTSGNASLELVADINQANGDGFINSVFPGYFLHDGRIYMSVIRGNASTSEIWAKDVSSGDFINISAQLTSGEHASMFGSAVSINGRLYFSGSYQDGELRQLVSYATGEDSLRWHGNIMPPSPLPFPHYFQGLTEYEGNLIFGAILDYGVYNQLFLFDTDTESFSPLPGTDGLSGTPLFIIEDQLFFKGSYADALSNHHYFSVDLVSGDLVEIANDSILGGGTDLFAVGNKVACGIRYPGSPNVLIQLYDPITGLKKEVLPAGFTSLWPAYPVHHAGKTWFYSNATGSSLIFTLDPVTDTCEMVLNLEAGTSVTGQMLWYNDKLYFHGETNALGQETFVYDPATDELSLVADLNPGPGDSAPRGMKHIGDRIYFKANDGGRGRELWSLGDCFSVTLTAIPDSLGQQEGAISLSIDGGTAPLSFTWNTGATTQDITGLSSGFYEATVTDAAGCEATIFTLLEGGHVVNNEEAVLTTIKVYPNPASDVLQVEMDEIKEIMEAYIFNYSGVKEWEGRLSSSTEQIDISTLQKGFHFIVIISDGQILYREKLLVH